MVKWLIKTKSNRVSIHDNYTKKSRYEVDMETNDQCLCQIYNLPGFGNKNEPHNIGKIPIQWRVKLFLKRLIEPNNKRKLKVKIDRMLNFVIGRPVNRPEKIAKDITPKFKAGERIRVRSKEEIEATLNFWHESNGCLFMDGMKQYFDTAQTVLKPVERFVDERDYRIKKTRGIYLLEGLTCEGTNVYGPCDRCCYYFWREEWLEKII